MSKKSDSLITSPTSLYTLDKIIFFPLPNLTKNIIVPRWQVSTVKKDGRNNMSQIITTSSSYK